MKTEFLKVKFEADAGSSGSDLEIVCIKPASKKVESVRLQKEASSSQPSVRGPFCKQGHDTIPTAPPADVIKNACECENFNVMRDLCGVLAADNHTYRSDACDWDMCVTCANQTKWALNFLPK